MEEQGEGEEEDPLEDVEEPLEDVAEEEEDAEVDDLEDDSRRDRKAEEELKKEDYLFDAFLLKTQKSRERVFLYVKWSLCPIH